MSDSEEIDLTADSPPDRPVKRQRLDQTLLHQLEAPFIPSTQSVIQRIPSATPVAPALISVPSLGPSTHSLSAASSVASPASGKKQSPLPSMELTVPEPAASSPKWKKRIWKEFKTMCAESERGYFCEPINDSLSEWRAWITGPDDSCFTGGFFELRVMIPNEYPFKPPTVTFITPVFHCNVSQCGSICLDILKDKWSAALSLEKGELGRPIRPLIHYLQCFTL